MKYVSMSNESTQRDRTGGHRCGRSVPTMHPSASLRPATAPRTPRKDLGMRKSVIGFTAVATAFTFTLAACGGDNASSKSGGATTAASATTAAGAATTAAGAATTAAGGAVSGKIGVILPDSKSSVRWETAD